MALTLPPWAMRTSPPDDLCEVVERRDHEFGVGGKERRGLRAGEDDGVDVFAGGEDGADVSGADVVKAEVLFPQVRERQILVRHHVGVLVNAQDHLPVCLKISIVKSVGAP